MDFNEYEAFVGTTGLYPMMGQNLVYPALGLVGEAGEVADKIKKLWRNRNVTSFDGLEEPDRQELVKELGDCLWYCVALAKELGVSLEYVATQNVIKLQDRKDRGVIKSEGDNR